MEKQKVIIEYGEEDFKQILSKYLKDRFVEILKQQQD